MTSPVELSRDSSWKEESTTSTRSRYSGYPLKADEMVITILSQGELTMGHQVIAFEWNDSGLKNRGVAYRKHKAFHLYPAAAYRAPDTMTLMARAVTSVPGEIQRTRATTGASGVLKSASKYKAGSDEDASSRVLTRNAKYRSWKVDFATGWKAFQEAKADWKNPPQFNLLGTGGHSCATWVRKILATAGISTGTLSGRLGYPVPANEVADGAAVLDEDAMWVQRGAH